MCYLQQSLLPKSLRASLAGRWAPTVIANGLLLEGRGFVIVAATYAHYCLPNTFQ